MKLNFDKIADMCGDLDFSILGYGRDPYGNMIAELDAIEGESGNIEGVEIRFTENDDGQTVIAVYKKDHKVDTMTAKLVDGEISRDDINEAIYDFLEENSQMLNSSRKAIKSSVKYVVEVKRPGETKEKIEFKSLGAAEKKFIDLSYEESTRTDIKLLRYKDGSSYPDLVNHTNGDKRIKSSKKIQSSNISLDNDTKKLLDKLEKKVGHELKIKFADAEKTVPYVDVEKFKDGEVCVSEGYLNRLAEDLLFDGYSTPVDGFIKVYLNPEIMYTTSVSSSKKIQSSFEDEETIDIEDVKEEWTNEGYSPDVIADFFDEEELHDGDEITYAQERELFKKMEKYHLSRSAEFSSRKAIKSSIQFDKNYIENFRNSLMKYYNEPWITFTEVDNDSTYSTNFKMKIEAFDKKNTLEFYFKDDSLKVEISGNNGYEDDLGKGWFKLDDKSLEEAVEIQEHNIDALIKLIFKVTLYWQEFSMGGRPMWESYGEEWRIMKGRDDKNGRYVNDEKYYLRRKYGAWNGPFDSLEEAQKEAERIDTNEVYSELEITSSRKAIKSALSHDEILEQIEFYEQQIEDTENLLNGEYNDVGRNKRKLLERRLKDFKDGLARLNEILDEKSIKSAKMREPYDRYDEWGNYIPYEPTDEEISKADEIKKALEPALARAREDDPMDDYAGYDTTQEREESAIEKVAEQFDVDVDFVAELAAEVDNERFAQQMKEQEWAETPGNLTDKEEIQSAFLGGDGSRGSGYGLYFEEFSDGGFFILTLNGRDVDYIASTDPNAKKIVDDWIDLYEIKLQEPLEKYMKESKQIKSSKEEPVDYSIALKLIGDLGAYPKNEFPPAGIYRRLIDWKEMLTKRPRNEIEEAFGNYTSSEWIKELREDI